MGKMMIVGGTLLSENEFKEKAGQINHLTKLAASGQDTQESIITENGVISVDSLIKERSVDAVTGQELDYEPIGIGKPLGIEILTVYSGDFVNKISLGSRELLLMSAIKSSATYGAQANAINLMVKKAKEHSYLDFSTDEGTRVVFYTSAVDTDSYEFSFRFLADSFDKDLVDKISRGFKAAATIPVFLSFSTILLAGSELLSIAGEAGNKLLQKKPLLSESLRLQFGIGGLTNSISRKILITSDYEAFTGYEIRRTDDFGKVSYKLFNKSTNKAYDGDEPYLILNIDGRKRVSLESFAPQVAAAAILQKFGQQDADGSVNILRDAMQLYNDYVYKDKADRAEKKLSNLAPGDEYDNQKALLDAYRANIQNDIFKP